LPDEEKVKVLEISARRPQDKKANNNNKYTYNNTDCRMIYIDQNKLSQVFRNLVANAIKFSSPGDVVLVKIIEVERENPHSLRKMFPTEALRIRKNSISASWRPQKYIRFEFIDTGTGIRQVQ